MPAGGIGPYDTDRRQRLVHERSVRPARHAGRAAVLHCAACPFALVLAAFRQSVAVRKTSQQLEIDNCECREVMSQASHGAAGTQWECLKMLGNRLQHRRHEKAAKEGGQTQEMPIK